MTIEKQISIDKSPILRGKERIPFEKINAKFITLGWDSDIEHDPDWGWCLLITKKFPGFGDELRRIKPFKIIAWKDLLIAVKLQKKLRIHPVEIFPYKTYKGNRIFFPEVSDYMDFMSEAKFGLFRKFFQTSESSLDGMDKLEAKKNDKV